MFQPPPHRHARTFAAGFFRTFSAGAFVLVAAACAGWIIAGRAAPGPLAAGPIPGPSSSPPASGYHHEGYTYIRGARVKIIRDGQRVEDDPEWQRLHNVILPCGHRWAYYTSGTYSSRRDVCEQGHSFVFEEGVWVPKPPDPEPGPASGAWPGNR